MRRSFGIATPPRRSRLSLGLAGFVAAVCCGPLGSARPRVWRPGLAESIGATIEPLVRAGATVGACVVELDTGRVVYQHQADEALIPASNLKLVTTAAAIEMLGPDFAFQTRLLRVGPDLVVVGGGDPATGDGRLCKQRGEPITAIFERWAQALQRRRITTIDGDLVLDDSIFDDQYVHPNWPADQYARWYAAPVGGLNFNDNCVELLIWPGPKPASPVGYKLIPPAPHIRLVNRCLTGRGRRPVVHRLPQADVLILTGRCAARGRLAPVAVRDPAMLFGWTCKTVLAANGVEVRGGVSHRSVRLPDGSLPLQAELIAVERTALPDVLRRCNKRSQNLFAECLLKMVALKIAGQPSWQAGRRVLGDFLRSIGAPVGQYRIDDGSGLSRANRLSARVLVHLLCWMDRHRHRALFIDSLSVAGRDGTLRRRMDDPTLRGRVRAKTGSLAGVTALSGYVQAASGHRFVFSLLFNELGGHVQAARRACQRICKLLVAARPTTLPTTTARVRAASQPGRSGW
ncbi:MAG: D-alanyl-D-alanine carboxypeptidase/D-alanyl-D-alanine-endopeptidase [Phycisphaerae bacterium]